ncbi:Methyltransferase domain-containing protein [Citreimonas salinaria]|uniref:Methyltransferase domain-containing protein n=1 Tax=Citreimonas salinaria TaxID=321339 RepID=A0A1H3F156_9RHOB|nr:Methyltransferase domain-containing protein [Citreimonas salinaria]
MTANSDNWRQHLYENYVSSGQGGTGASARFRPQKAAYQAIIRRHVPQDRSTRILDLGCGAGGMLYFLKEAGYTRLHGVDYSAEMVELAHGAGLHDVQVGDLFQTLGQTQDGSFDVIFTMDVLEHMTRRSLFTLVAEMRRVLAPGGRVILHVPNAAGLFGSKIRYSDLTHELAFTATSLRQLFQSLGFSRTECFEDRPLPRGLIRMMRAIIWEIGTLPLRLLHGAETGSFDCILSQNLTAVAYAPDKG